MAQVDERATRVIKRVVPAVWVLVLVRLLNPLEDLEERLELNLTVGQEDVFESLFVSFSPTFLLETKMESVK